jgi:hypothetical protein
MLDCLKKADKEGGVVIMKRTTYRTILAVMAMTIFGAVAAMAHPQHQPEPGDKTASAQANTKGPEQRPQDMSDTNMSGVTNEPHQVLARAYIQNIGTFAKALRDSAQGGGSLSADFARVAVEEMKRNFDAAEEHHREYMKTISAETRSKIAVRLKQSDMHRSRLNDALAALEKHVRDFTMNSKKIAAGSADVLKHLNEISKIQGGNQAISANTSVSLFKPSLSL